MHTISELPYIALIRRDVKQEVESAILRRGGCQQEVVENPELALLLLLIEQHLELLFLQQFPLRIVDQVESKLIKKRSENRISKRQGADTSSSVLQFIEL